MVNAQDILQVGRAEIRVSRLGETLTAGQLMQWDATLGDDRTINIVAKGWFELFKYRLFTGTFDNKTAAYIANNVLTQSLAKSYGNLGGFAITVGAVPSPDNTNVYVLKEYENQSVYDLLVDLSEEENGFDMEFTWDKRFNMYHPRIGQPRPDIILSYPGIVKNVTLSRDTTRLVNSLLARGQGFGETQQSILIEDLNSKQTYGLREATKDWNSVGDETQLENLGSAEVIAYKDPLVVHEVVLDGGQDPQVGSYRIGDQVQIYVRDLPLYSDVNKTFTIDRIDVSIDDNDAEDVTLGVN